VQVLNLAINKMPPTTSALIIPTFNDFFVFLFFCFFVFWGGDIVKMAIIQKNNNLAKFGYLIDMKEKKKKKKTRGVSHCGLGILH